MKTNVLLSVFLSAIIIVGVKYFKSMQNTDNNRVHRLLFNADQPTSALNNLLKLDSIEHDNSLSSIVQKTQEAWIKKIRPALSTSDHVKERWEIQKDLEEYYESKKELYVPLLKSLALNDEIAPQKTHYDYILFMGGPGESMNKRLEYLKALLNKGITCGRIVALTGQRLLDTTQDVISDMNIDFKVMASESMLCNYLFSQYDLPSTVPVTFIATAMIKVEGKTERRPTTGDTIIDWINAYSPHAGSVLVISDQPFCNYQQSVTKTYLPTFDVDVAGPLANPQEKIVIFLDTLGRWLYQELQRVSKE